MKFKMRTILLGAMTSVIIIPMLIIFCFYNTGIKDLFEARCQSYSHEIIKQAGENVNTLLNQLRFTEKKLASEVRTSQILLEYSQNGSQQKMNIINDLERMIWNYKQSAFYISDIYLFGHNNRLFSTTTTTSLEKLKNAPWIQSLTQPYDQSLITATHKAHYDVPEILLSQDQRDKYVVSFVRKVYHLGLSDKYSIVQTDIKYSEIEKIMESIDLGMNGFAVIVNANDEIVYCNQKDYLGMPASSYMERYASDIQGQSLVKTSYKIGAVDWDIIGCVSTEAISAEFRKMNQAFIMAIILSLLAASLLAAILSHQITQTITGLSRQMRQVGSGNFSAATQSTACKEFSELTDQFNQMVDEIDDLMYLVQKQEQEKATVEFQVLQNQINPHFMYNTLNTLKWMALMDGNQQIAQAIVSLVKLLKFTYSDSNLLISIENEMQFLKDYVAIQKLRYNNVNNVTFRIEPEICKHSTLKFILQPIVENAFVHGFPESKENQDIVIEGEINGNSILFTVTDNGVGMDVEKIAHFSGLGIMNVDQRIQMHFGKEYGVKIYSVPQEGTKVQVRIPLIESEIAAETGGG